MFDSLFKMRQDIERKSNNTEIESDNGHSLENICGFYNQNWYQTFYQHYLSDPILCNILEVNLYICLKVMYNELNQLLTNIK